MSIQLIGTSGKAEGIGGGVASLQTDLVRAHVAKIHEEIGRRRELPLRIHVQSSEPASNAARIELRVPGEVERVGHVDATAIATQLDHLRPTVERPIRFRRMRRAAHYSAEVDRGYESRRQRGGGVVAPQLAG